MIPSVDLCFELMDRYHMLDNIRAHSLLVARVAHLIARGLRESGVRVSVGKATAGALLHDIGKTMSLNSGKDHSEVGRRICIQNQMHEIADIVGQHVRMGGYDLSESYSEKEIVYYSDKRVNHARIVTLEERLAYILVRYGRDQEGLNTLINMNFALCKEVEKKLFSKLHFGPELLPYLAGREILETGDDGL